MKFVQMSAVMTKWWFLECPNVMKQTTQIPHVHGVINLEVMMKFHPCVPHQPYSFCGLVMIFLHKLFHLQVTAESKFLCHLRTFHFHGCKLFFGWWPSKFIYGRNKRARTSIPQYSWTVSTLLRLQLQRCHKNWMWAHIGISFMIGIDMQPEIVLYWSTQLFFCTQWYGKKKSLCHFQHIYKFLQFADNDARPDYTWCDQS